MKFYSATKDFHSDCGGMLWAKDGYGNYECDACGEIGKKEYES